MTGHPVLHVCVYTPNRYYLHSEATLRGCTCNASRKDITIGPPSCFSKWGVHDLIFMIQDVCLYILYVCVHPCMV